LFCVRNALGNYRLSLTNVYKVFTVSESFAIGAHQLSNRRRPNCLINDAGHREASKKVKEVPNTVASLLITQEAHFCETVVNLYYTTRHCIPEDSILLGDTFEVRKVR